MIPTLTPPTPPARRTPPARLPLTLADALNTTLDLNTLMHRVADLVRAVIDYRIFAILLINDRTHELWMRFQTGHTPKSSASASSSAAASPARPPSSAAPSSSRTCTPGFDNYINANPAVRSELAVPLIVKNKVIGVLDLQSETPASSPTTTSACSSSPPPASPSPSKTPASTPASPARPRPSPSCTRSPARSPPSSIPTTSSSASAQLLKRVIDFQMFTILLWNERTEQFEHRFSTRYGERITRERNVALGAGLIGTAAQERAPILSPDVRKDPRYVAENPETRSELSVPLIYKGRVIGVIDLEHTRVNYYNEDHQRTLTTLASQVAISIANARLYQRIHEEEQRMERDLDMAREVQLRLLPAAPPTPAHAEIAARFLPARSIGGDLYDFLDYGRTAASPSPSATSAARPPPPPSTPRSSAASSARSPHAPAPRAAARRPQRAAAGAQARRPVRHHAHRPLGRRHPHPHARQRRLRPALFVSPGTRRPHQRHRRPHHLR